MPSDTFETINTLSEERFQLYQSASRENLTLKQQARIEEIAGRLALLWDQYRRELAPGNSRPVARTFTAKREQPDADWTPLEEVPWAA